MKKILIVLIVVFGLLGVISAFIVKNYNQNKEVVIDCNKPFSVFYLKSSELGSASEILKHNQAVVISFDEENNVQLNARTESLKCPNFDSEYYIQQATKTNEMFK